MLECNIINWLYRCLIFCQNSYYKLNNYERKNVGVVNNDQINIKIQNYSR